MSHELSPAKGRLTDGLGPDALTYARERVSLLGAGEYVDTVNRALDAMDGLPVAALLGGWTFKGFTAWAQGLESEIARLTAALKRAQERDELLRAALAELLAEPVLSVKRREWKTLSPEAQAKLNAMSGDPGPEYWRQQALGAERARKVRLR